MLGDLTLYLVVADGTASEIVLHCWHLRHSHPWAVLKSFQHSLVTWIGPCPYPYQGEGWMAGASVTFLNVAAASAGKPNFEVEPSAASADAFALAPVASAHKL